MQNFITRQRSALAAGIALLCAAAVLTACSAARLAYSNGETLVYWWLNGYADFDAEQAPAVKRDIAALFAWHRSTQLKTYARNLAHTQKRLQQPVGAADVLADYADLKKHGLLLLERALPSMASLALTLKPEQIAHIEEKFATNNRKYRKEYLRGDLEQRQAFRFRKTMGQAEHWFGEFSAAQEQQLKAVSDARPMNNELALAVRERRQQALLALLRKIQAEKPGKEAAAAMLRQYAVTVFDGADLTDHRAFYDTYRDGNARLVAAVVNHATPAQKAHAVRKLQQWIDDFSAMTL